jgi:hypothetical protein
MSGQIRPTSARHYTVWDVRKPGARAICNGPLSKKSPKKEVAGRFVAWVVGKVSAKRPTLYREGRAAAAAAGRIGVFNDKPRTNQLF